MPVNPPEERIGEAATLGLAAEAAVPNARVPVLVVTPALLTRPFEGSPANPPMRGTLTT